MSLVITCPDCGGSLQTPDDSVGKNVKCPKCGKIFAVTAPKAPLAVRSTAPAEDLAPPPRQRRAAPRADDDDEDYEPAPRRSRREPAYDAVPPPSTGAQVGLGAASLALGAIGVLIGMIPCFGVVGLPVAIIGFLLGAIGLVIAFVNERHGLAMPLAGTLLNLVGIGFVVVWFLIMGVWASETTKRGTAAFNKFAQDLDRQMEAERQRQQKIADEQRQQKPDFIEVAQRRTSVNNLKQLALAMHEYHDANRAMPAAGGRTGKLSWRVEILPYLNEEQLYKEFRLDEAWDSPHNKQLLTRMPKVFQPVRNTGVQPGYTYYQVFTGPDTPFFGDRGPTIPSFTDGASNTFLIVEGGSAVPWTKPEDIPYDALRPLPPLGALFTEGYNVALADAAVRFIRRQQVPERTIRAMITPHGGEEFNFPDD